MEFYRDRDQAGTELGRAVRAVMQPDESAIVLALPRGGVPVASRVAQAIGAPLDVLVVRKLGVPFDPEYAFGAIASGGARYLDERVTRSLALSPQQVAAVTAAETIELNRREAKYRGGRPLPTLTGKTVIIVDDGIATGSTARAAITAVKQQGANKVILAVPVAPADTADAMRPLVDAFVCPLVVEDFQAVGQFYLAFGQVEDAEVIEALS